MTDQTYDARGLLCPLPVLKSRKLLAAMDAKSILTLHADDPMARIDIPHFCAQAGHILLDTADMQTHQTYRIQRGGQRPDTTEK